MLAILALGCLDQKKHQEDMRRSQEEVQKTVAEAKAHVAGLAKLGQAFIDDIAENDVAAAYARTSKAYQATVPLERFEKAVRANPYLKGGGKFTASRSVQRGSSIELRGSLETSDGPVNADLHLLKTNDGVSVSGFTIAGQPALPGPS
jgi:hypothetical protein